MTANLSLQTIKTSQEKQLRNAIYNRLFHWPQEMNLRAFNSRLQCLVMDFYKELGLKPFPYLGYRPRGVKVRGFYKRVNRKWELVLSYDCVLSCVDLAGVTIFHLGGTRWQYTTASL